MKSKLLSASRTSPHWVWAAIDPVTKLLLIIDVGERTLAMANMRGLTWRRSGVRVCIVPVLSQILRDARKSPAGIGVRRPGRRTVRLG